MHIHIMENHMSRIRYTPKAFYDLGTVPFIDAEDAWFWYSRCQILRNHGVKLGDMPNSMTRPCSPDDIHIAVTGLLRRQIIGNEHMRVLCVYGIRESPPDPRSRDEERPARLWDEALDRLTTVLRPKGIVE